MLSTPGPTGVVGVGIQGASQIPLPPLLVHPGDGSSFMFTASTQTRSTVSRAIQGSRSAETSLLLPISLAHQWEASISILPPFRLSFPHFPVGISSSLFGPMCSKLDHILAVRSQVAKLIFAKNRNSWNIFFLSPQVYLTQQVSTSLSCPDSFEFKSTDFGGWTSWV